MKRVRERTLMPPCVWNSVRHHSSNDSLKIMHKYCVCWIIMNIYACLYFCEKSVIILSTI